MSLAIRTILFEDFFDSKKVKTPPVSLSLATGRIRKCTYVSKFLGTITERREFTISKYPTVSIFEDFFETAKKSKLPLSLSLSLSRADRSHSQTNLCFSRAYVSKFLGTITESEANLHFSEI